MLLQGYATYAAMQQKIDQNKTVTAPVTISIVSSCPSLSGNAQVTIKNTSQAAISGTLQFVVKESGIKFSWQSQTDIESAVRALVPDQNGEAVTINAGQSITKNRSFTINSSWVKDSCALVAFLQKSDKSIVEGCISKLNNGTINIIEKAHKNNAYSLKNVQGTLMLSLPENGKGTISVLDVKGRELKSFAINSTGDWIKLPATDYHGIVLLRITIAQKEYTEKIWLSE
jgi:hypothetical protein